MTSIWKILQCSALSSHILRRINTKNSNYLEEHKQKIRSKKFILAIFHPSSLPFKIALVATASDTRSSYLQVVRGGSR